jgi:hypothetical protein
MSSLKFLIIATLLEHVVTEAEVDFLDIEMIIFAQSLSSQADALLIAVLSLLCLLKFFVHIALLLIDGADQIRRLQLFKNSQGFVQI